MGVKNHLFFFCWVAQPNLAGPQRNLLAGLVYSGAILLVSEQGMTCFCKLDPNLMGTPGEKLNLNQAVSLFGFQHLIF